MSDKGKSTVKHNAKFTGVIMDEIQAVLNAEIPDDDETFWMLDPFGGVGGVFALDHPGLRHTDMVEIQPLWAEEAERRRAEIGRQGLAHTNDLFEWWAKYGQSLRGAYRVVATSPCYGNRMADKHNAQESSKRNTYAHTLREQGEELAEGSSGGMQWGNEYRMFHLKAWKVVWQALEPGGLFIMNIKNHIRKGQEQYVAEWHRKVIEKRGFDHLYTVRVPVRGNQNGENGKLRIGHEEIQVYRKPYLTARDKAGNMATYTQPTLK